MRESRYQRAVILRLRREFPRCFILKNDPQYLQGVPDLTVLYGPYWALLEVKQSIDSPEQPNQRHYIDLINGMGGFASFIYPENEEEVFCGLQQTFSGSSSATVSRFAQPQQLPLGELHGRQTDSRVLRSIRGTQGF